MNERYDRDLDLNLLRVFVVTAEAGSVTEAARRLYLTQPAISAALKRLALAVGAPLFARSGRGLALTARGERLLAGARPHLEALVTLARAPERFDPLQCDRVVRLGLSDASEMVLLAPLLRALAQSAPRVRLVVRQVQFRSVAAALANGAVELAVTVADELAADVRRARLFTGHFACVYDPRHLRAPRRWSLERYLSATHVIVSYNGDLRGVVEDTLSVQRDVRVSVPSFQSVGAVIEGSSLVATVPQGVARAMLASHPHLAMVDAPLALGGAPTELLWRASTDDDDALRFVREQIARVARASVTEAPGPARRRGPKAPAKP